MRRVLLSALAVLCLALPAEAQSTATHTMYATVLSQGCTYYPLLTPDWTCWVTVQEFGSEHVFTVELLEDSQALGQVGQMAPSLPRKAFLYYVLRPAGIDYLRGIVRSQVRVYFVIDAGPAT